MQFERGLIAAQTSRELHCFRGNPLPTGRERLDQAASLVAFRGFWLVGGDLENAGVRMTSHPLTALESSFEQDELFFFSRALFHVAPPATNAIVWMP